MTHFRALWPHRASLLGFVNGRINREWNVFHLATCNERKDRKGLKWLFNIKRIQTRCRPICTSKPDANQCMRVDLPLDKKTWKIRTGPPGHHGPRAAGPSRPLGLGPLGLRAAGPLFRRGAWAAGLFLAKPVEYYAGYVQFRMNQIGTAEVQMMWLATINFLRIFWLRSIETWKNWLIFSSFNPFPSMPSVAPGDRKQFQYLQIVCNNKTRSLVLEFNWCEDSF